MVSLNLSQTCAVVGSMRGGRAAHLVETNVLGLLTEALTAQVEVVLADETSSVLADAAVTHIR